jgi:hypothetical protein
VIGAGYDQGGGVRYIETAALAFAGLVLSKWGIDGSPFWGLLSLPVWIVFANSLEKLRSPQFIEDWLARRRTRERELEAQRIIRNVKEEAEKIRRERIKQGLPAEITYAEWEEFLTTKRMADGPWGDDGRPGGY